MGIPYKVMEMQSKEWYYKWTEGVIVGYLKGTIEEKRALGMLKRAKENIGEEDLKSLFKNIKIGAYIANEKHLDELKAKLKEEYGNELIEDTLIGQKVNEHLGDLKAKLKEEYGNEL